MPTSTLVPLSDHHSRRAALVQGLALPGDTLLYLLLPMYADQFGVSLAQAGMLLAANRLVRIAGYGLVARFYARRGDRCTSTLAVIAASCCALGYASLSGFWALLPLRLLWGMAFAALNLSTQTLATLELEGTARRSGQARAFISLGPMVALPCGTLVAQSLGPHGLFLMLAGSTLLALPLASRLPSEPHVVTAKKRSLRLPNGLDAWSFLEGLTLDGLFLVGLSYLGQQALPGDPMLVAGLLLALRYLGEILLSPVGGRLADRVGPERLLVTMSLLTAIALVGFGLGWLWICALVIVVLRSLQLPLLAPIVARRTPGPERIHALAKRAIWRDIGAGLGPMLAGLLLPQMSGIWIYGIPAVLLVLAAFATLPGRCADD